MSRMDEQRLVKVSRYLARHLRHRPEHLGLTLDAGGWAEVDELVAAAAAHSFPITVAEVEEVVPRNDKQRYELDAGRRRIRARQGHSVAVELGLEPADPPEVLWHGTVERFLPQILAQGLRRMGRNHVHLSADAVTARVVGARRGRAVVLSVAAGTMAAEGHRFWLSTNGVWLTGPVPPRYLSRCRGAGA